MRLLDLFCGAGGASRGYVDAGFEVVGVDINPQRNYPYTFTQMDALNYLDAVDLSWFDAIHASPPCQLYSGTHRINSPDHPDLIAPTRRRLIASGLPYVIENVIGAPLIDPILLCGRSFRGLRVYRHRLFESNIDLQPPIHYPHDVRQAKMGRPPQDGEFMHVVGNFSGVEYAKKAMGIDWMVRNEMSEAIPPAYAEFIGRQILLHLRTTSPYDR